MKKATWQSLKIGSLGSSSKPVVKAGPFGSSIKKEFYVSNGYKVYGQEQVISGNAFFGDYYIDEEKYQSLISCKVQPDDILISLVGTVGRVLLLPDNCELGIINPRLLRISVDKRKAYPLFIKLFFESDFVKEKLLSYAQGGTMGVLNAQIVKALDIELPPLLEQVKIAAILSSWDDALENLGALLTAKRKLKRGLMQQLLTGRVRFKEFEARGEAWEEKRLETISVRLGRGKSPSYTDGESNIVAINQKCVRGSQVNIGLARNHSPNKPISEKDLLLNQDICVNSTGTGTVGRMGLFVKPEDNKKYFPDSHITVIRLDLNFCNAKFILEALSTDEMQNHIEANCIHGSSNQVELSRSDFANIEILVPPLEEQRKIALVLATLDQEISTLEQERDALKRQKCGLMQVLLTGKVRVNVTDSDDVTDTAPLEPQMPAIVPHEASPVYVASRRR